MFEHCVFPNALYTLMLNDTDVISDIDHLCHRSIQEIAPRWGQLKVLILVVVCGSRVFGTCVQRMPGIRES